MADPARTLDWTSPNEVLPPKDRVFMITTAGPQLDLCAWDSATNQYRDYYHRQRIVPEWPYMVAWCDIREPADVMAFKPKGVRAPKVQNER